LTPATGEAWLALVRSLTDDELARYGQIANDQYRREVRWWWAQALLCLAAGGAVLWALRSLFLAGSGRLALLMLGFSALLGYWPYRKAKSRRLWWGHYQTVVEEQQRRLSGRG
jgi:hypothetical protein